MCLIRHEVLGVDGVSINSMPLVDQLLRRVVLWKGALVSKCGC